MFRVLVCAAKKQHIRQLASKYKGFILFIYIPFATAGVVSTQIFKSHVTLDKQA